MTTFMTIVVPAEHVDTARATCAAAAPGGHGMFTTALSADGSEPATHYISSGLLDDTWQAAMSNPDMLYAGAVAGAEAQGIPYTATYQEMLAAFASSDVSLDPPFDALARLGLKLTEGVIAPAP